MFRLKINNFRSLVDQQFDFSRINILIGENSAGKSSVLKFLLTLRHSVLNYPQQNLALTKDLGTYKDVVYQHDDSKNISFEFGFGDEFEEFLLNKNFKPINQLQIIDNQHLAFLSIELSSELNKYSELKIEIFNDLIGKLSFSFLEKEVDVFGNFYCNLLYESVKNEKTHFSEIEYKKISIIPQTDFAFLKSSNVPTAHDIIKLWLTTGYIGYLVTKISYINPIDSQPERFYTKQDSRGLFPVSNLHDVVSILTDKKIDKSIRESLLEKLNQALNLLEIAKEVRVNETNVYELEVRHTDKDFWCNIQDVGFGVAMQIPVIFKAIVAEQNGGEIILIEQPEVHIHPFLQSKFIETLVKIGNKNTYFIETHSPDIIRKLQVMVKQNELPSKDVSIHYFKRGEDRSIVQNHTITENGRLNPKFPEGFYDTAFNLSRQLL